MNQEQQVKEMLLDIPQKIVTYGGIPAGQHLYCEQRQEIAEALYNAGYRKVADTEAEIEILKIQNKNLGIAFDRLEAENERLTERLKQVLLSIDTVKEMNAMCNIDEQRKQAVKEFAEKLKRKAFNKDMFNDWAGATYVVLVREIDKLLKEYEK